MAFGADKMSTETKTLRGAVRGAVPNGAPASAGLNFE
jgi:hypothetical protein